MFDFSTTPKILLACGATDMRLSFRGLSAIVRNYIDEDPNSGHLFLFCNRRCNRLKILYHDQSGLWVLAKRLEQNTFKWPQYPPKNQSALELSVEQIEALLKGWDISKNKRARLYRS